MTRPSAPPSAGPPGPGASSSVSSSVPKVGVEEELHVVDLETRQAVPEVEALLARLPGRDFAPELQRSLVETNSAPCHTLDELRTDLVRLRRELDATARGLGLGVVSAGTVPLTDRATTVSPRSPSTITPHPRYERMQHEYQMLVREQLICGTQVHVDVPDRDVAVAVTGHVAPWLPVLLALSASSPYWQGADSGYASARTLVWSRWPTSGPPGPLGSAAEYDAVVAELVASGTISDPGMVYFDVRPSAHLPTVELRVCDACPGVDGVVLLAGLFRGLVARAVAAAVDGRPVPRVRHELLRAATWRAARSGLEGDLVDLRGPGLVPPGVLVARLLDEVREPLEETGDLEQVTELARAALAGGSAAARQRRAYGQRGELADVVDALLAETRGEQPVALTATSPARRPAVLRDYHDDAAADGRDEVLDDAGVVRPHQGWLFRALDQIGLDGLRAREVDRDIEQRNRGVTFGGAELGRDRLFPLDLVPRIVTAAEWAALEAGLVQRVRALEAFLQDVYGPARALRDGVLPAEVVYRSDGYTAAGRTVGSAVVRAAISGIDLVRTGTGRWQVLEDNLRVPSGIGYALMSRRLLRTVLPELEPPGGVAPLEGVPELLLRTLRAALPPVARAGGTPALLTEGPADPAHFEHRLLAEQMGVPLAEPADLAVRDEAVVLVASGQRVDVLYRRIDEDALLVAPDADGKPLGPGLRQAVTGGVLSIVNGMGNGVADDKLVYAYVPRLVSYYLGEEPRLDSVPTYPCLDPERREEVLGRLDELVLKPVNGYGGRGIVIGPHASPAELDEAARRVRERPEQWVAQDLVQLSTHPTAGPAGMEARAVDLRAFVLLGERAEVAPAALTRVAPRDSYIVNSSRGGGAKDTWILR